MTINKLLLKDDVGNKSIKHLEDKIKTETAATYYKISSIFALSNLSKLSLRIIERRFTLFANSHSFLELDSSSVAKILSSDKLHIDSELQVYNTADKWLCNNTNVGDKISNNMLLKTRFPLLSVDALKYILNKTSTLYNQEEFAASIKEVLQNNNPSDKMKSKTLYKIRYCDQNKFNVIVCGGSDANTGNIVSDVYNIEANNINNVNVLPPMKEARRGFASVTIKDDVYVFGGFGNNFNHIMSVEKYSAITNTWETIAKMCDNRIHFCACSFIDNVYIIGGTCGNSCFEFNIKERTWNEVASMNEARWAASCAVFDGRIVVTGGNTRGGNDVSKTVTAYDSVGDKWSYMPNMIESRVQHKSVAINNKLFVISGHNSTTCEVFDSTCNKFALLKSPQVSIKKYLNHPAEVVSVGSKLLVFCDEFGNYSRSILFYDVDSDEWSEESWKTDKYCYKFSCVKVPQL